MTSETGMRTDPMDSTAESTVGEHYNGNASVIIFELHRRARNMLGQEFHMAAIAAGIHVRHTTAWLRACRMVAAQAGFTPTITGKRGGFRYERFVNPETGRVVDLRLGPAPKQLGVAKRTPTA